MDYNLLGEEIEEMALMPEQITMVVAWHFREDNRICYIMDYLLVLYLIINVCMFFKTRHLVNFIHVNI
jgi:hypothetical protein